MKIPWGVGNWNENCSKAQNSERCKCLKRNVYFKLWADMISVTNFTVIGVLLCNKISVEVCKICKRIRLGIYGEREQLQCVAKHHIRLKLLFQFEMLWIFYEYTGWKSGLLYTTTLTLRYHYTKLFRYIYYRGPKSKS